MPISDASFNDTKIPLSKFQKMMKVLERGSIEAHFTDERGEPTLTREYVDRVFQDYAISQQNPQIMNKWIALDTKLDKSLLEYTSDVKMLIASVTQISMAQALIAEPLPATTSPGGGIPPTPVDMGAMNAQDRKLPVNRED